MNYKVLYRKYRPDNFDTLIGQNHVVTILKNSIKENRIAHAYLFSGPRGTGKTSTARILAKAVNCSNPKDGMACMECENCLSFFSSPDIIEIDAASNNGVDEIRELINNIKIMPTSLKYKVYIIDEVHMLSQSAFNALLLTLEEPPEHVIFILATTNIESVPITILSRCQRFDFKRISNNDIVDRLKLVCDEESIKYKEDGLKEIAILSDGGLRDALSLLDQLSKKNKEIDISLVANEIGSISNQKINDLIKALDDCNINLIDTIFNELEEANLNYKVVIKKIVFRLSEVGSLILSGNSDWKMDFDDCKKLILELNDLMNKININVEPYLLIKMLFFGSINLIKNRNINNESKLIKEDKNYVKKEVEKIEKEKNSNVEKTLVEPNDSNDKYLSDLINIRINNCFVNASKKYLVELKQIWNEFMINLDNALIKGLVSDTMVVAASDSVFIIAVTIPHKDLSINEKIDKIEKLFNEYNNSNYKMISIDIDRWNLEKSKYVSNLKKNFSYKIMDEPKKSSKELNELNDVASIFDIDKIEVE